MVTSIKKCVFCSLLRTIVSNRAKETADTDLNKKTSFATKQKKFFLKENELK